MNKTSRGANATQGAGAALNKTCKSLSNTAFYLQMDAIQQILCLIMTSYDVIILQFTLPATISDTWLQFLNLFLNVS